MDYADECDRDLRVTLGSTLQPRDVGIHNAERWRSGAGYVREREIAANRQLPRRVDHLRGRSKEAFGKPILAARQRGI